MSGPESEGLLAGSKFGVYEVGECIGRGAMGQVYRAEHTLLRRPVALKIMTAAARSSTTGHRRFKREARAAAAIKHPNVVEILDMGVLDGLPFIVMELLEGEDLESYLARHGKLSEQQLADLALPIIAAVGAVHDAGVVHRDIKPSNIFLAKGGREEPLMPKVLDFGISKAAKSMGDTEFVATGPGDLVGTPLYISPEALKGAQYLTARSDQYSLGVVLYQCAVGRRPHEAKDLAKLVRSILSDPIEPPRSLDPSLSPELDAAVMRALSRNPDERFGHVRDLGAALWLLASQRTRHVWAKRFSASLAYTLPPGAPAVALPPPPKPRSDLRPLGAGLAAAVAVLATGYVVSVAWPPRRTAPPSSAKTAILAQQPPPSGASTPAVTGERAELALAAGGAGASAPGSELELAAPGTAPAPATADDMSGGGVSGEAGLAEAVPAAAPAEAAPGEGAEGAPAAAGAEPLVAQPTVAPVYAVAAEPPPVAAVPEPPARPRAAPRRAPPPVRTAARSPAPKAVAARAVAARRAPEHRSPAATEQPPLPPARQPSVEEGVGEASPSPRGANQSPILD